MSSLLNAVASTRNLCDTLDMIDDGMKINRNPQVQQIVDDFEKYCADKISSKEWKPTLADTVCTCPITRRVCIRQ